MGRRPTEPRGCATRARDTPWCASLAVSVTRTPAGTAVVAVGTPVCRRHALCGHRCQTQPLPRRAAVAASAPPLPPPSVPHVAGLVVVGGCVFWFATAVGRTSVRGCPVGQRVAWWQNSRCTLAALFVACECLAPCVWGRGMHRQGRVWGLGAAPGCRATPEVRGTHAHGTHLRTFVVAWRGDTPHAPSGAERHHTHMPGEEPRARCGGG